MVPASPRCRVAVGGVAVGRVGLGQVAGAASPEGSAVILVDGFVAGVGACWLVQGWR